MGKNLCKSPAEKKKRSFPHKSCVKAKKGVEIRKDFRQVFSHLTKQKFPMKINCKKVKFMLKWDYHIMFRKEGKAK